MLNITVRHLHYLVALAETGSFSRAANRVGVTQSTLSAAIQSLELELGAPLVDRSGRKIQMLPSGDAVVRQARDIIVRIQELPEHAAEAARPLTTRLRLGVIPSVAPFILPKILPSLTEAYPELNLSMREGLTRDLLDELRSGRLDAAIIARPYQIDGFDCAEIGVDPFFLAIRNDHPLAKRDKVDMDDVEGERFLLLETGHCLREHVIAAVGEANARGEDDVRASSIMTLVQMMEFGLGVTLLPRIAIEAGATRGTNLSVVPYVGEHNARSLVLIWRSGAVRRHDYHLLAEHLRHHCMPAA
ncbi:MAG: hydrogen peroxide-inducible genes activator [Phyllobacterium sp.]